MRSGSIDWRAWFGRSKKFLFVGGFSLVVFLVALVVVFPYQRAAEFAEGVAAQQGYQVEIGEIGPTLGFGITVDDVKVKTRDPRGGKGMDFKIDHARITTNPWVNLTGGMAYSVTADAFDGEVEVDVTARKDLGEGMVNLQGVSLASLPGVKSSIGLPVKGTLDLVAELALQELKVTLAEGSIDIECHNCEVGDGKAKLKIENNPMLREGIALPRIRIGDLKGKIDVKKGVGKIVGLRSKSPDLELIVEGEIRLADPMNASYLDAYVRFKLDEKIVKSQVAMQLFLQFANSGKRDDGFYGFRLAGPLRGLRAPQWMKDSPISAGPGRVPRPSK